LILLINRLCELHPEFYLTGRSPCCSEWMFFSWC